jgi:hypothetical protein
MTEIELIEIETQEMTGTHELIEIEWIEIKRGRGTEKM